MSVKTKNTISVSNDTDITSHIGPGLLSKVSLIAKKLFCQDKSYLWLCFAIPIAIMYVIYLALDIHPFGDGSVLVLDLNAQYVYFYEALREFVWGDQSLLYSFSRQLGGEFMGIYAYYLASPLSYIVAFFPKSKILEALLTIILLKTGLCGVSFGYYLHKTTQGKRKKTVIVAFSLMYALCSYAIVQQNNSMWIDALFWLPILVYSIEQLITHRKFKLFVVSLAMVIMSNYYIGYMVCIFVALYFFYYYVAKSENGENNPFNEKNHFAKSLLRIIIYSALAIGISAIIILTAYYSLSFGKTTFSDPSWKFEIRADIMDFLTKFLPGSYDTVRRSGLPFVYCGVLTLLMLPVYFISPKVSNREKAMSGVLFLIFMLSFMINVVDLVWHGFQEPNWINYRYSFMLSFLMLVMAYKGFVNFEQISTKVPLVTAGFISMFLIVAQKYTFSSLNSEEGGKLDFIQTIAFTFICLAVYLIVLAAYKKSKNQQSVAIALTLIVSIEMFANGISNVGGLANDVVYSTYSSYNDFISGIRPTVEKVQRLDTSFYRMEKINHRRVNDNMALNIRGLSNSSSTLNRSTVEILRHMGYASSAHKSTYYGGNPINDSLLGLRYIIVDSKEINPKAMTEISNTKELLQKYYDLYTSDENYNVYYNKYALSLAYGVSNAVTSQTFVNENGDDANASPYQTLNQMVSAMLGSENVIEIFNSVDNVEESTSNCDVSYIQNHYKYAPEDSAAGCSITYTFSAEADGDYYFYLPSDYPREVKLEVNGVSYGSFYGTDTNRGMFIGSFNAGEGVKLKMTLKSNVLYVQAHEPIFHYLDQELFENSFDRLAQTQMIIDDEYKEDHITGTVKTTSTNQTIMTTIPYDTGWIVKVDGEVVNISQAFDAFIAFEIDDIGEHTIEFIYRSKAFVYGAIISAVCLGLFLILIIFEKSIYKFIYKKLYDDEETYGGDIKTSIEVLSDDILSSEYNNIDQS